MTAPCPHTIVTYQGRCEACGERIESPSQAMLDYAERTGGTIVHMTKTIKVPAGMKPEDLLPHLRAAAAKARASLAAEMLELMRG